MKEIVITPQNAGGRLDKLLLRYLDKAPGGFVYKMLRKKNITLNDKKADGGVLLNPGDVIKLYLSDETIDKFHTPEKESAELKTAKKSTVKPDIVFEDENILAVNKPSGLLSQKSKAGDVSVNDFVVSYIPSSGVFKPGIANRLDRNTSGIVLAGKNPASARELSRAIRQRDISKKYLALVKGSVQKDAELDGFLLKDEKTNKVTILSKEKEDAERIRTDYHVIGKNERYTLLEIDLITGKSHQIRAHLASIGHPIAGDPKYGDKKLNEQLRKEYKLKSQLLHAYKVEFTGMIGILDYLNGTEIKAPLPDIYRDILKKEGIDGE